MYNIHAHVPTSVDIQFTYVCIKQKQKMPREKIFFILVFFAVAHAGFEDTFVKEGVCELIQDSVSGVTEPPAPALLSAFHTLASELRAVGLDNDELGFHEECITPECISAMRSEVERVGPTPSQKEALSIPILEVVHFCLPILLVRALEHSPKTL